MKPRDYKREKLDFLIGRLILIADPADSEGLTHIESAFSAGYNNREQFEKLITDSRLTESQRKALEGFILTAT